MQASPCTRAHFFSTEDAKRLMIGFEASKCQARYAFASFSIEQFTESAICNIQYQYRTRFTAAAILLPRSVPSNTSRKYEHCKHPHGRARRYLCVPVSAPWKSPKHWWNIPHSTREKYFTKSIPLKKNWNFPCSQERFRSRHIRNVLKFRSQTEATRPPAPLRSILCSRTNNWMRIHRAAFQSKKIRANPSPWIPEQHQVTGKQNIPVLAIFDDVF